jgi:hypothetical protein
MSAFVRSLGVLPAAVAPQVDDQGRGVLVLPDQLDRFLLGGGSEERRHADVGELAGFEPTSFRLTDGQVGHREPVHGHSPAVREADLEALGQQVSVGRQPGQPHEERPRRPPLRGGGDHGPQLAEEVVEWPAVDRLEDVAGPQRRGGAGRHDPAPPDRPRVERQPAPVLREDGVEEEGVGVPEGRQEARARVAERRPIRTGKDRLEVAAVRRVDRRRLWRVRPVGKVGESRGVDAARPERSLGDRHPRGAGVLAEGEGGDAQASTREARRSRDESFIG